MGVKLVGCGKAIPALKVPNSDLEFVVDTNDEWISSRTGIQSRNISVEESVTELGFYASLAALGMDVSNINTKYGSLFLDNKHSVEYKGWNTCCIDPLSIDLIICLTITPDAVVPNNASLIRRAIGCDNAIAFDVNAACSGFIYGLSVAQSMITASHCPSSPTNQNIINRALIVSAERLSRLVDWSDRNTCVLFGDGSGAVVLEWSDNSNGILSCYLENTDDNDNSLICKNTFNSLQPFNDDGVVYDEDKLHEHRKSHPDPKVINYDYIHSLGLTYDLASDVIDDILNSNCEENAPQQVLKMDGQRVFKFAARTMDSTLKKAANMANIDIKNLNLIVPHQANLRIIEYAAKRLDLPLDRFQISIQETGNTSSAGVPMSLADALCSSTVKQGDTIGVVAFGGGLTSGAAIIEI